MKPFYLCLLVALLSPACKEPGMENSSRRQIQVETYGTLPDGRDVRIFTLTNTSGLRARVMEYGATLVSIETPDREGKMADVTLGYDSLEGWLGNTSYFGSSVGRYGNRIAHGKFTLDGKEYALATNNSPGGIPCHLHGGVLGFDKVLWHGNTNDELNAVTFSYVSADGEEGYPGNLTVRITYTLTEENELRWEAEATTDAPTVLNLVHHSYWNLTGDPSQSINRHELTLHADQYLPTNPGLIPLGNKAPVADTPMDFREATLIGARVDEDFEALVFGGGYDHAWVLRDGDSMRPAARLRDPQSGRVMEIRTNQPGIQFYGGNFLDGSVTGKSGVTYERRTGLCLETENFPDAPNQADFPSAVLRPGETYRHTMVHGFSAK